HEKYEKATESFYRITQDDAQRWWLVRPDNTRTVMLGVDHVTYNGHWCETLGYSPYARKNDAKYSSRNEWEEETLARLKSWGFNTIATGDKSLRGRGFAHCEFVNIGDPFTALGDEYSIMPHERRPCSAFPNVFHPDFPRYAQYRARRVCAPLKNDPDLIGYFIDNELRWWGGGEWGSATALFDAALAKPDGHHARAAALAFKFENAERFATEREMKTAFLRFVAERYFKICSDAIRAADPNHLVLGARFAGTESSAPCVWEVAGEYCDVVSFNYYPSANLDNDIVYTHLGKTGEPVSANFARYAALCKKPMLVTEWSFPALDAGLPSVHGAGQRFKTQTERARATELFAREMLAMPFLIGYDYFMWSDEPALGISANFPEDSNYGLVNEDNIPYKEITTIFSNVNYRAEELRCSGVAVQRQADHRSAATQYAKTLDMPGTQRMTNPNLKINAGNTYFGRFTVMAHIIDEHENNLWLDANSSSAYKFNIQTEIVSSYDSNTKFIAQIKSITNTGKPFKLKALYFRLYSDYNGVKPIPPNVWKGDKSGYWHDSETGGYFGCYAPHNAAVDIYFWVNSETGRQHPDARYELSEPILLNTGDTYAPPDDVFVICVGGIRETEIDN
ncbi:MAG: hypothetical protein FWG05_06385, partial [Kiritimatiellaeota bacterium]|nr:hypothetical protein [Kiritimatiellota bacterium]